MNIEDVREYSLSLPFATEDFPFNETILVFRVLGKIFVFLSLDGSGWFALKCAPDYALELRELHPEIKGAFHLNKKYWNQVNLEGELTDDMIKGLIRHSYSEVVKKFPKRVIAENPILATIKE